MKIVKVTAWPVVKKYDCVTVFQVTYSSGSVKRWYSSYTNSVPETVSAFCYRATKKALNSTCTVWTEE